MMKGAAVGAVVAADEDEEDEVIVALLLPPRPVGETGLVAGVDTTAYTGA